MAEPPSESKLVKFSSLIFTSQKDSHLVSVGSALIKRGFHIILSKNCPYLDNFLTNPIHILAYSGDSDPKSPENHKICMGLVTKLSRYGQILTVSEHLYFYARHAIQEVRLEEKTDVLSKNLSGGM